MSSLIALAGPRAAGLAPLEAAFALAAEATVAVVEAGEIAGLPEDAHVVLVAREPDEAIAAQDAPPEEAGRLWQQDAEALLDALDRLAPERWSVVHRDALLAEPRRELRRLCLATGVDYHAGLVTPLEQARAEPRPPRGSPAVLAAVDATIGRLRELVPEPADAPRPLIRSVSTDSLAARLEDLGASLLVSTYQTGKIICVRQRDGRLNTHFRDAEKPMGLAVAGDRLCVGTRTELLELRDVPAAAAKLEPAGSHDACFVPRRATTTGDVAVHDVAYAGGEPWFVATAFSCLATRDDVHSFVPRWTPPFVSELAPGDRCHLNGLATVEDEVRYVTALGQTDAPGAWRVGKADGGVLLEVPSGAVVASGLSMPHSPRWHEGRLWLLESGRGALCVADLATGRCETVAELPGFTRGMAIHGRTAFVGLSQIRETSVFGDLPITRRLDALQCGVWSVDLPTGRVEGFLRFDELVQEIFDVAVLPGRRWPEIAGRHDDATAGTYVIP